MQSIATVTGAPAATRLTSLDRMKAELGVTDSASDALIAAKIDEASSDIEAHLARTLSRATLTETFWPDKGWECVRALVLARAPVVSVTSVTVDDVALDASAYRLDAEGGRLFRLDASGYPTHWEFGKSAVVVYTAGYLLPEEAGRTLPHALEGAVIELVQSYWLSRGRDPMVRGEDVPGLGRVDYWVGSVGAAGELPPSVMAKISPFLRIVL